jgi:hypothetical protein
VASGEWRGKDNKPPNAGRTHHDGYPGRGSIMSRRRRGWWVLGLAVVLVAAFAAYLLYQVSLRRAAEIDSAIQNGPLAISISEGGGNAMGGDWKLQLDSARNATLKINFVPTPYSRRIVVPRADIDELRNALQREHFFDLADSYGELVADGATTTIQVTAGEFSKTVELHFLGNWTYQPERLREPNRALHVVQLVRSWFDEQGKSDAGKK